MKILKPENIDFNSLSTIIFDWGGVITNIDYQATIRAFQKLGHPTIQDYFGKHHKNDVFLRFETGHAEPFEIHRQLIEDIGHSVSVDEINEAFCAMLSDTPLHRINILKKLHRQFRLFLLSNTNIIHTDFYMNRFRQNMSIDFTGLFDKVYFSNKIGMRKPDSEIYEFVLHENKLVPRNTLFIDDMEVNIVAADLLGLQVFQVTPEYPMEKIFAQWMN